ncbi:receptor-like protein EIX1 [Salvia hispanica]|uniref:receptor-like protein EIX1 n=1 Tax=Salvia hispanica TaxID=49212 RepID=UPI00200937B9|nr:receptor-like protein EIX1 [Salvia hispanica]
MAIKFLVVVLVCVFVSGEAEVRCIEREREALLSFKNGLIDDYGFLSSWESDECCKWHGVECSNATGHVINLQLNNEYHYGGFQGEVGSSLLELYHLNYLDLSWNDFGGNPIPKFIGSMKQLQHLYLRGCNFGGIVPPQIGNLTNLQSLALSHNSLRIENLNWLSSLSLLSYLSLSQIDLSQTNWLQHILSLHSLHELHLNTCNLKDSSPSLNSSSTSLSILALSDNHLTFSALNWLSNISTVLVEISMSSNAIGGSIPIALLDKITFIEHLDLSDNMLEGQIPKSLCTLSRLRVLVLYENDLSGNLENLFGNACAKGILESLQILELARNKLDGSLPDLRAFSALTEVYLEGNNFTGSIPPSIGQLSNLHALDLSGNFLNGIVSESHFKKLDMLKMLDLSFNSLILHFAPNWIPTFQLEVILLAGCNVGPSFPKWIQTQRNFSVLDLSIAGIIDEAPTWLWSISPLLEHLFLSSNQISGTIPNLSSTSITFLDLSNNSIAGPIPLFYANAETILLSGNMFSGSISSICKTRHNQLVVLDLYNNQLLGELPNCWKKMPNMVFLNVANNRFWGEIPRSLGSLHELAALQLRGNRLSGEFPSTLRRCQNLELVDVAENELTGDVPIWLGEVYNMRYLNLAGNKLHGGIPVEICNLTRIRILDLSKNNLSGKIPDCFNSFTSMAKKDSPFTHLGHYYSFYYNDNLPNENVVKYFEYSSIQWKGQESEYRKHLILLKLIDLSSNRLSGNIPQSFSNMKGLISLNLSSNSFTGNIIPDIGEMEMLECLDLSDNQLSGKIPTSLAQLQYLAVLDLSNNNLSGEIPTSTQLQSFNASAYAENDGLCGPPLALCNEDVLKPPTTNPGGNADEKGISLSFMQEVGISMGFGFIFGFWGVVGTFVLKKSWRIAFFKFL